MVEEEAYKKLLADEKDRRSKEQKLYGDYLKVNKSVGEGKGLNYCDGFCYRLAGLKFYETVRNCTYKVKLLLLNQMQDQMMQAAARKSAAEEKMRSCLEMSRMQQNAKDIQMRRRLGQINVQESHIALG